MGHTLRMAKNIQVGKPWDQRIVRDVGEAMKRARAGKSARVVSETTAELGHEVSPTILAKLDSGHRGSVLTVPELLVLAAALKVPPVSLLFGGHPDEIVEVLPGQKMTSVEALAWFIGDRELAWPGPEFEPDGARDQANAAVAEPGSSAVTLLDLIRQRAEKHREIHLARWALNAIDSDSEQFGRALEHIGKLAEQIDATNLVIDAFVSEGDEQ
jgi:hypothetical protein